MTTAPQGADNGSMNLSTPGHSDQVTGAPGGFGPAVRRRPGALAAKALVALVPWLMFWVAALTADRWVDFRELTLAGMRSMVPFTLALVFLPALAAVSAAPSGVVRYVVTVLVTGVAVYAGVTVVAMDDGQAGLSIFWVPLIAVPLAVLVAAAAAFFPGATSRAGRGGAGPAHEGGRVDGPGRS